MTYIYTKNANGLYVCPHCNVTKKNQNTMHYHMKTHEGKLPFECSTCKKQFLHASTLELHKRAQHEVNQAKTLKCPVKDCPFEGTLTKSNLLIHYIRKHCKDEAAKILDRLESGGYKCRECNKESKSLTAFHYHCVSCVEITDEKRKKMFDDIRA